MKMYRILILLVVLLLFFYLLYTALPFLIAMASNTIYLGGALIFLILFFYGIYRLFKWAFSKS